MIVCYDCGNEKVVAVQEYGAGINLFLCKECCQKR